MNSPDPTPGSPLDRRAAWVKDYAFDPRVEEVGKVLSVGDGVAWIEGLPTAAIDEILKLEGGSRALVFHLTFDRVGAILLEEGKDVHSGAQVFHSGQRLALGVGDALLGRVIDPLGVPLDGNEPPLVTEFMDLDAPSPPILSREAVQEPLFTGNKIVDTLIPIGKGQRQLLIGDNGLGKSSLAVDITVNQKDHGVLCVYVLVGQRRSGVMSVLETLRSSGALAHTLVVVAESTALPGLQYLAPFAGFAAAEYWMRHGRDTLVVVDDLTAHANSYRELSLLLRRPPGREAFPADIFFLHSRLLERATHLSAEAGGGSLTALPIIETKEGEIAAYIPTNLISITDGQVFFDQGLFASGFLFAIDVTRSVSRVGGKAQWPAIKRETGRMKLDYLQYLELEVFTRFGAKLEAGMQSRIDRGRVLREVLKQDRLAAVPPEGQLAWLLAFNEGFLDATPPKDISARLQDLFAFVRQEGLKVTTPREAWMRALGVWATGAAP